MMRGDAEANTETRCPDYTHQHPGLALSLRTRTWLLGTLNLAIALRGKSCGWGTCQRPRRTFVGHIRTGRKLGYHFATLSLSRDALMDTVWERTIWGEEPT